MLAGVNTVAISHLKVSWLELLKAGLPKRCCASFIQGNNPGAHAIKVPQQLVLNELRSCKQIWADQKGPFIWLKCIRSRLVLRMPDDRMLVTFSLVSGGLKLPECQLTQEP